MRGISEEKKAEIEALLESGKTVHETALITNVAASTVSRLRRRIATSESSLRSEEQKEPFPGWKREWDEIRLKLLPYLSKKFK